MNKVATLTITLLNILLAQSIDMDKFKADADEALQKYEEVLEQLEKEE